MRYIGIDFGSKRIGVSISDDTGKVAFPHKVISNDSELIERIKGIIENKGVQGIVLGKSIDLKGEDNEIMEAIYSFEEELKESFNLPVFYEEERFSTVEARKIDRDMADAHAATIILQNFLDRQSNKDEKSI